MPIIILSDEDHATVTALLKSTAWRFKGKTTRWDRLAELFEKAPDKHTIRIVVSGGVVEHVEQLPMGFDYEVLDFDNCCECGGIEPLCDWCKTWTI